MPVGPKLFTVKRYDVVDKKVVEIGAQSYPLIHIIHYVDGPPVLEQCGECSHAVAEEFIPQGCDDAKNLRSMQLACTNGHDIWEDGACTEFRAGAPLRRTNPLKIVL